MHEASSMKFPPWFPGVEPLYGRAGRESFSSVGGRRDRGLVFLGATLGTRSKLLRDAPDRLALVGGVEQVAEDLFHPLVLAWAS
jgi:hypothetical protein